MKKIVSHFIAIILIIIMSVSCDFVQNANPPLDPTSGTTIGSAIIYRKALVEDYTGHKCGNCPEAAKVLQSLETLYGEKIVPLAIHAGSFAGTTPVAVYPTDFRTIAGTAYNSQFGFALYPNGLVNRVGYGTASFIKAYTVWGSEVAQMITQTAKFQIKIKNTFNTGTNSLNTDITIKSLTNNTGTYKLVVLLTEDSIIAEQLDYSIVVAPPITSQLNPNYEFNHVLRGAINSEWGDAIFTGTANLNDSVVKSYTNYTINSNYKPAKCHVVAYVYDADAASPTYYEVYQAEEAKVK